MSDESIVGSGALWIDVINGILGETHRGSLLDLCCGHPILSSQLGFERHVGVDLNEYPESAMCSEFRKRDALDDISEIDTDSYELALCSDGLEHFKWEDGIIMLGEMARVGKLAIVFVPTKRKDYGYSMDENSNDPHVHKSLWSHEQFQSLGWQTRTFPNWHPTLNLGACFAWNRKETEVTA